MKIIIAISLCLESPSCLEKFSILESVVMGLRLSIHNIFWFCAPKTQGILPFLYNNDNSIMLQLFLKVLAYISSIFLSHFVPKKTHGWKCAKQVMGMVTTKWGLSLRKIKLEGTWNHLQIFEGLTRGKKVILICVLRAVRNQFRPVTELIIISL